MIGYTSRAFILTALVGSAVAAAPSANPGTHFDGRWSIRGFARTGPCTTTVPSFQSQGEIINGIVQIEGLSGLSARIASSGVVNLTLSAGEAHFVAVGRLSNDSGSGSWRLQGPRAACSGTWSAQRSSRGLSRP